jgi:hypothetical protein
MKPIEKIKITPEIKEHYKKVGLFLKSHPEIEYKKLAIGYQVNIGSIPSELVDEWIELVTFKN